MLKLIFSPLSWTSYGTTGFFLLLYISYQVAYCHSQFDDCGSPYLTLLIHVKNSVRKIRQLNCTHFKNGIHLSCNFGSLTMDLWRYTVPSDTFQKWDLLETSNLVAFLNRLEQWNWTNLHNLHPFNQLCWEFLIIIISKQYDFFFLKPGC